jgi:hypothetical protein
MGKIMKCVKITLLHAFFVFNCFGMQAGDDGGAFRARRVSVIRNFVEKINKDVPVGHLLPLDGGAPIETTTEEQRAIEKDLRLFLSLRKEADNAAPVNAAINANNSTTDGTTIKVTKDAIDAAIEKINAGKAAIEADDKAIKWNIFRATLDDEKAGITHTLDLLEKLTNGIVRRNIPLLVTLNSFNRFWINIDPGKQREDTCYRYCIVRNGRPYLAFLIVLLENKEESESELAFKDGCWGNIVRFVSDNLYHEFFHANAICWQYPSHFASPTLERQVGNLQRIAGSRGIQPQVLLGRWHNDAEFHCLAGVFLDSQGKVGFDPLCVNARMIKTKGGIFSGHIPAPILGEMYSIPGPLLRPIAEGKKSTDLRFTLYQLKIDGTWVAVLKIDEFLIRLNKASSSRVLSHADFGYNFLFPLLECGKFSPIARGKLRDQLMRRVMNPDSKVIVQK